MRAVAILAAALALSACGDWCSAYEALRGQCALGQRVAVLEPWQPVASVEVPGA